MNSWKIRNTVNMRKFSMILAIALLFMSCRDDKLEPEVYSSLSGIILSSETNLPLSNVSITTKPSTSAILTDVNGEFKIESLLTGQYTISTKKDGYNSESVSVNVQEGIETTVSILMKKSDGTLDLTLPHDPIPADESTLRPISLSVSWIAPDISGENDLKFDVFLYENGNVVKNIIASDISDTVVENLELEYETSYLWQVNTTLSDGTVVQGEVWTFKTKNLPDNRFLFTSTRDGNYEVYSTDSSTADLIRLTNSFNRDWNPLWSPNKDLIAYTSNRVETHIYTMNPNGTDAKKITPIPVAGFHNAGMGYAWSPGGGYLIFPNYENLYRIDKNGINLTWLSRAPSGRHYRQSDWTAQGNNIVVETVGSVIYDNEIYIMSASGTNRKQLVGNWPGIVSSPSFSIGGQHILFTHDISGLEATNGRQLNAHIFIMNINDTTDIFDVSVNKPDGTNDVQPRYSPDGAKVIFVNENNDGSGDKEIWIVNTDGTNRKMLFNDAEMPDWQ